MANRRFYQFLFSLNPAMTFLEGNFVVGSTGAVSILKGSGIQSVTRLGVGTYQITLSDSYFRYLGGSAGLVAPVTGNALKVDASDAALTIGKSYIISVVGDATAADWLALGVASGITPAVGVSFVALATGHGTASVSRVMAAGVSGIETVEIVGDPNLMINNATTPCMIIQCLSDADAPADPAAGSVLGFHMFLRNSSLKGKGE